MLNPVCSENFKGLGLSVMSIGRRDFLSFRALAWDASSMYFTVQAVELEPMIGSGAGRGLGMLGLRRAPLNFTIKKKHPRKTP